MRDHLEIKVTTRYGYSRVRDIMLHYVPFAMVHHHLGRNVDSHLRRADLNIRWTHITHTGGFLEQISLTRTMSVFQRRIRPKTSAIVIRKTK